MAEPLPEVSTQGDRVVIEVAGGRWEGTAAEAERIMSGLHYALERARPGTNVGSMFLNGQLWGAKFIEQDRRAALREMRFLIQRMEQRLESIEAELESPTDAA